MSWNLRSIRSLNTRTNEFVEMYCVSMGRRGIFIKLFSETFKMFDWPCTSHLLENILLNDNEIPHQKYRAR